MSKNIHNSGALSLLIRSGTVKALDDIHNGETNVSESLYVQTDTGIVFNENDIFYVHPSECEVWKYANRSHNELGDIEELMESIRKNSQLQPVLVRENADKEKTTKYEIIFGRRRYEACLRLNIPLLAIKKNISNIQDAILMQDAENKIRKNVSNYSNAVLYKKLLDDKVFASENELSKKISKTPSSFSELMTYTKIPSEIISCIPEIHNLPIYMATKINVLLSQDKENYQKILAVAGEIGKKINTPKKLEEVLMDGFNKKPTVPDIRIFNSEAGKKLFTFKIDHKGYPSITFTKDLALKDETYEFICKQLVSLLEERNTGSD
ncbi:MAG: ParB/RepB/Spo0J family partition protein [Legionellales bacterium]|nr:ParB/RepB/Spo0J family partition protein [Legionellales bacterium]